jgi:hypothetical protein
MGPTVTKIVALPKATSVVGSHGMFWARLFFVVFFQACWVPKSEKPLIFGTSMKGNICKRMLKNITRCFEMF